MYDHLQAGTMIYNHIQSFTITYNRLQLRTTAYNYVRLRTTTNKHVQTRTTTYNYPQLSTYHAGDLYITVPVRTRTTIRAAFHARTILQGNFKIGRAIEKT